MSTFTRFMTAQFLRPVLAQPVGRAFVLNQIADAEDNGEAEVFDQLLDKVDDPQLFKMIRRHRDDEIRHGEMFRACMRRTGVDPGPVPAEARLLDRIDEALGGFFAKPITCDADIMEAYLILQVIEERAVEQFGVLGPAFASVDPKTTEVFRQVAADEERHLKYCHAISKRYAPSEGYRQERLQVIRKIEAAAFLENRLINTQLMNQRGIVQGRLAQAFWLAMGGLAMRRGELPWTSFAERDMQLAAA